MQRAFAANGDQHQEPKLLWRYQQHGSRIRTCPVVAWRLGHRSIPAPLCGCSTAQTAELITAGQRYEEAPTTNATTCTGTQRSGRLVECTHLTGAHSPQSACTAERDPSPLLLSGIGQTWLIPASGSRNETDRRQLQAHAASSPGNLVCLPWTATSFQGCDAFGNLWTSAMQGECS